jgi:hypothetical protein
MGCTTATGRSVQAKVIASAPIAEGWIEYELEVPPEVHTDMLGFSNDRPDDDAQDSAEIPRGDRLSDERTAMKEGLLW